MASLRDSSPVVVMVIHPFDSARQRPYHLATSIRYGRADIHWSLAARRRNPNTASPSCLDATDVQ